MNSLKTSGDSLLDEKIAEWIKFDQNEETKTKILALLNENEINKLKEILLTRLTFGTAGIRGRMGTGYACMNDLLIIQTSQGLAEYLLNYDRNCCQTGGVVIGYDGRHNSERFAKRAAAAFVQRKIPVHLFRQVVPTPFIPFSVKLLKLTAGIMITASHNPKDDNGYKVYFTNGAQITSPHDKKIQASIEVNLEPWPLAWDLSLSSSEHCKDPLEQVQKNYYKLIHSSVFDWNILKKCTTKFTHTSLHGVGHSYVAKAFESIELSRLFNPVKEQQEVNADFPTVHFPNPEEGKGVLNLSIETANKVNSNVIIANDPDVDRCSLAERQSDGNFRIFTGNEIGALLGWWLWFKHKRLQSQVNAADCFMIASTVSSKILASIAQREGFNFLETLTGFKWMGNKADELIKNGKTVLLAFEEAIGYMCNAEILDKDGITAAIELVQLNAYLEVERKITLTEQLENIYKEYGFHFSLNSYFICYDQMIIKRIFDRIANFNGSEKYPTQLGQHKIIRVRDLNRGYDNGKPDNKPDLPLSSSSYMVTIYLDNGVIITIRTSGTEPKIKYYSEVIAAPGNSDRNTIKETLNKTINLMINEFLEPNKNSLIAKVD